MCFDCDYVTHTYTLDTLKNQRFIFTTIVITTDNTIQHAANMGTEEGMVSALCGAKHDGMLG